MTGGGELSVYFSKRRGKKRARQQKQDSMWGAQQEKGRSHELGLSNDGLVGQGEGHTWSQEGLTEKREQAPPSNNKEGNKAGTLRKGGGLPKKRVV